MFFLREEGVGLRICMRKHLQAMPVRNGLIFLFPERERFFKSVTSIQIFDGEEARYFGKGTETDFQENCPAAAIKFWVHLLVQVFSSFS